MKNIRLVLASNSPRRKQLLSELGEKFIIVVTSVTEDLPPNTAPRDGAAILSLRKAQATFDRLQEDGHGEGIVVLGSDTVVAFEGKILGKPKDEEDARRMLGALSGNTHTVYTGVSLVAQGRHVTKTDCTKVTFKRLSKEEIDNYIESRSPMDKAGAYGIQDGVAVQSFEGSYSNVVGLPQELTKKMLKEFLEEETEC